MSRLKGSWILVAGLLAVLVAGSPALAYDTPHGPGRTRAYRPGEPGYRPNAHGLFTVQAISILRNDGKRDAADLVERNIGSLLDGVRAADQSEGYITLDLGFASWNFLKNAFTHFYEVDHGRGLRIPFVPDIPLIAPSEWDVLRGPHPAACRVADWHYAQAVHAMRAGHVHHAFYHLGFAIHLVQDLFVPQHARHETDDWFGVSVLRLEFEEGSHSRFESWSNDAAPRFLVDRGGFYRDDWTAGVFVREAAGRSALQLQNARDHRLFERAARNTFPDAQRFTAGLLAKFSHRWATEPYSALRLTVRQVTGINRFIDPIIYTPDFYVEVNTRSPSPELGGNIVDSFRTRYVRDDHWAWPADPVPAWSFHVQAHDADRVALDLQLWDSDWGSADDPVDISPSPYRRQLELSYHFRRPDGLQHMLVEGLTGETYFAASPPPGRPAQLEVTFAGNGGDRARIRFTVEAVHVPRLSAEAGARLRERVLAEALGGVPDRPVVHARPLWSRGDRLYANWQATLPGGAFPVDEYQYLVLTAAIDHGEVLLPLRQVRGWTGVGLRDEAEITGLRLDDRNVYFVEVRARNRAGWSEPGRSEAIHVDSRGPGLRVVEFRQTSATLTSGRPPNMRIHTHPNSVFARWWAADFWDWYGGRVDGSGIGQYTYQVRQRPAGTGAWQELASGQTTGVGITLRDLPLVQGAVVSLAVLVHDRAGNPSEWMDATFTVAFTDLTPPAAPVPRIGIVTSRPDAVQILWDPVHDPESGVYGYEFGIGTVPDRADVLPWLSKGRATEHMLGMTLRVRRGVSYYLLVRVTNGAGLTTIGSLGPLTSVP